MSIKLDKGQLAEINDLYVENSFGSIRELAKLFNVSIECIRWTVNYKDYREEQTKRNLKWQKANPAWYKIIQKRAYNKHKKTERFKETRKKYYWKNRERILAHMRASAKKRYYEKKRSLNN